MMSAEQGAEVQRKTIRLDLSKTVHLHRGFSCKTTDGLGPFTSAWVGKKKTTITDPGGEEGGGEFV